MVGTPFGQDTILIYKLYTQIRSYKFHIMDYNYYRFQSFHRLCVATFCFLFRFVELLLIARGASKALEIRAAAERFVTTGTNNAVCVRGERLGLSLGAAGSRIVSHLGHALHQHWPSSAQSKRKRCHLQASSSMLLQVFSKVTYMLQGAPFSRIGVKTFPWHPFTPIES